MFLSGLILIPLIGALVTLVLPQKRVKIGAIVISVFYLIYSLGLFVLFDPSTSSLQLTEKISWVPSIGMNYFIGVDGLNFWFILMTVLLLPLCVLGSLSIQKQLKGFLVCLFVLTSFVIGSFISIDSILFYIFFESSLLPLFFLILIWGGENKVYASIKFFLYTALGSLLMLIGIVTLIVSTGNQLGYISSSILDFYNLNLPFIKSYALSTQSFLFILFFIAFAIKTPVFPFHTWLPLAHVQAPTAGSVFLAAVVLKMGTYGFLRLVLPLFPEASLNYSPLICLLAVVGIIYGAFMALAQEDLKKLVAYSSVSHMGYVLLGLFVFNEYALAGGFFQMITHGLSAAGLFFLVGMIYERTHTRNISEYGGIAAVMPRYSTIFFLITCSAIALPLTGGFISEFLVLFGSFMADKKWGVVAAVGVVLGAAYMLYLIYRMFFGKLKNNNIKDLRLKEMSVLLPIVVLIFLSGLFPNAFFKYSKKSLDHLEKNQFNYFLLLDKR